MREAAVWALLCIAPLAKQTVPACMTALEDEDPQVRRRAATVLEAIGPAAGQAVPALVKALGDKDADVRLRAVDALGAIGPAAAEAVPALMRIFAGDEEWQRRNAYRAGTALAGIGKAPVPALRRMLRNRDTRRRQRAIDALGQIGPAAKDAVPDLIVLLAEQLPPDKYPGPRSEFMACLERQSAAGALGNIGPAAKAAIPAIKKQLDYFAKLNSQVGLTALKKIRGEEPLPSAGKKRKVPSPLPPVPDAFQPKLLAGNIRQAAEWRLAADNRIAKAFEGQVCLRTYVFRRKMYFVPKDEKPEEDVVDRVVVIPEGEGSPREAEPPFDGVCKTWEDRYVLAQELQYEYRLHKMGEIQPGPSVTVPYTANVTVEVITKARHAVAGKANIPKAPEGTRVWRLPDGFSPGRQRPGRVVVFGWAAHEGSQPMPWPSIPIDRRRPTTPAAAEAETKLKKEPFKRSQAYCTCEVIYDAKQRRWYFRPDRSHFPGTPPVQLGWEYGLPKGAARKTIFRFKDLYGDWPCPTRGKG